MKKLRKEVIDQFPNSGGLFELADIIFLQALNMTTQELDFLSEHASDTEIDALNRFDGSFTEKRKSLEIRNKYIKLYEQQSRESSS